MSERYVNLEDFKRDLNKYQTLTESIDICSSTVSKEFWEDIFTAIKDDCNNLVFLNYLEGFDDCVRIPVDSSNECLKILRKKEYKDYIYQPAGQVKDTSTLLESISKLDEISKKHQIPVEVIITFKPDDSHKNEQQVHLQLN